MTPCRCGWEGPLETADRHREHHLAVLDDVTKQERWQLDQDVVASESIREARRKLRMNRK